MGEPDPELTATYEYALPPELVAEAPAPIRTGSRLLVIDPASGSLDDALFAGIDAWLRPGDLLVVNDARVTHVRLPAARGSGGRVEVFVVGLGAEGAWADPSADLVALVRSNRGLRDGETIRVGAAHSATVVERCADGLVRLQLDVDDAWSLFDLEGEVPLPPYILKRRRDLGQPDHWPADATRYQTVFAREPGAVAAPTAGLHFDDHLLATLADRGIDRASVTLFVGAGTFKPVTSERLDEHHMHAEHFVVPEETAATVAETRARGGRVVAVGTTVVRTLEASWSPEGVRAGARSTDIFIKPGHRFRAVDALLTNFHLPRSTLLALVSAFAGPALIRRAYAHAVRERYRFYSYGDAMLLTSVAR